VVPYNEIKALCIECESSRDAFKAEWHVNLEKASTDFVKVITKFWANILAKIGSSNSADVRGALPGVAISLFVREASKEAAQELLVRLKHIHEAAYRNTEALRKLVKKFDKQNEKIGGDFLSPILLPFLYSANFTVGQLTLEEGITLLRDLLPSNSDDSVRDDAGSVNSYDSDKSYHDQAVEDRQAELDWLRRLTQSMDDEELSCLVAHRGFHSIQDYSNRRPIENSLSAYETAWTNGIHLCECDIALTKDEKLILAHDEDFSRLALNKNNPVSSKKIQDLTFKELISLPLTSVARPPLLLDVLSSAYAIEDNTKLVIEIKPGNEAAASALANILVHRPELMQCVAVIMSYIFN
jgi:hypothetical protein